MAIFCHHTLFYPVGFVTFNSFSTDWLRRNVSKVNHFL